MDYLILLLGLITGVVAVIQVIILFDVKKRIAATPIESLYESLRLQKEEFQGYIDGSEARLRQELVTRAQENGRLLETVRGSFDLKVTEIFQADAQNFERICASLRDEAKNQRQELTSMRQESEQQLKGVQFGSESKLENMRDLIDRKLTVLQGTVDERLTNILVSNESKLEQMRQTVDEKLHHTLEKRLQDSFAQVGQNLVDVQRGLGEMQALAKGVGNLNRLLTNVKSRGVFGETQLANILEDILTGDQYEKNYKPGDSSDVVEFAVKLPGHNQKEPVFIPIDAKFPREDYERFITAVDSGDSVGAQEARKALMCSVRNCAKYISEKYINPPLTTNFGIMFLATEGLYAEVIREPGYHAAIQRELKVIITGPTTLAAILNSLAIGFKTIAIETQATEIMKMLGGVHLEFDKFGKVLGKVQDHLRRASETVDESLRRSRAMQRKLRTVEKPADLDSVKLLDLTDLPPVGEEEDESLESA